MPLYEYECPACGLVFEELRRAGDESPASCPACRTPASRIVSLSAFALKGSGFHATDYVQRRPGSFQKDGKGTVKGVEVDVPQLARDPSVPLEAAEGPEEQPGDPAKEGA
ncbi:MAG: FmdB family zinc ribbon protein [Solidesulfovibrio sp. DCME]|uniref:FmdB family zinc ribbon protein n=1 Tax=Solidesulfovibrio sp. DCME TaxID=3447380 RepID=UPI003D0E4CE0